MARSQELARLFQQPDSPAQRHYEVCRAYFHDSISADEIAKRFHLYGDTVRAIVRDFARDPDVNSFFTAVGPGRKTSPKRDAINERACDLRRQGATLADIHAALQREGVDVSESYLFRLLRRAGLAATRQRRPSPQPGEYANDGSVVPDIADVRALSLEDGRQFSTKVAGLCLFFPLLLDVRFVIRPPASIALDKPRGLWNLVDVVTEDNLIRAIVTWMSPMPFPFAETVALTDLQRAQLESLVRAGSTPQALVFRCRLILRAADRDHPTNLQIAAE